MITTLIVDQNVNTIWYSPRNEEELADIIKNKHDYNCIITEPGSRFSEYNFIVCFYHTESEYNLEIFKGRNRNSQMESIIDLFRI